MRTATSKSNEANTGAAISLRTLVIMAVPLIVMFAGNRRSAFRRLRLFYQHVLVRTVSSPHLVLLMCRVLLLSTAPDRESKSRGGDWKRSVLEIASDLEGSHPEPPEDEIETRSGSLILSGGEGTGGIA